MSCRSTRARCGRTPAISCCSEIPEALGSDVVFIEGHAGDTYLDGKSDVDRYREVHVDALRHAL